MFCVPCLPGSTALHFDEKQAPIEAKSVQQDKALQKPTGPEYTGEAAKEFLKILEAVAQEIPVPGVSAAVKIATNLIKACEESHTTLEKAEELKLRIRTLVTVVVNQLKEKRSQETREKLTEDIIALQSELKYIEKKLDEIASQHAVLLILFRSLNEEKVQKCMDRLDGLLERFTIARQIDHANLLQRLEAEIMGFYDAQKKTLDHIHDVVENMNVTMEDVKAILMNHSTSSGSSSLSGARTVIPANASLFYGRDALVTDLVAHLSNTTDHQKRHTCILGPGGMGKTSTALAVMAHPDIKKRYPNSNRVWVPCVKATSLSFFLDTLSSSLGITQMTGNIADNILSALNSAGPVILLLDNFETPWNIDGGRSQTEQMLRDIDRIPHVTLFITMRSSIPPWKGHHWHSIDLKAIDAVAARKVYSEIYPEGSTDPELPELLGVVGHMPLAITLMATSASLTGLSAKELVEQYRKVGPTMLGHGSDAEHSMDICISLSVDSPPMKRRPEAQWLLAALAMLPVGTTYNMLATWWARHLANATGALEVLRETSLIERRGPTFFILPVIQRYVLDPSRFPEDIRKSMIKSACDFLKEHKSVPGDESYKRDAALLVAEESNLESVLLQTATPSPETIDALIVLSRFQASVRPRTNAIEHAVKLVTNMEHKAGLHGATLSCYAAVCHSLNRYEDARKHLIDARELFLSVSDVKQAAECLLGRVNTHHFDDSETSVTKKPLIARAQSEFESIQDAHGIALCWYHFGVTDRKAAIHGGALSWLRRAKDKFTELGDPLKSAQCSYDIALTYYRMEDYDQAKTWAETAVKEFSLVGPSEGSLDAAITLGYTLNARGEYAATPNALVHCLEQAKTSGAPVHMGLALEQMGLAWMKMEKREDARAAFQEALQVYPPIPGRGDNERCQYLLRKLDDSNAVPTFKERDALTRFYPQTLLVQLL